MKCPYCKAWTRVLETRQGQRRRRECGNGHTFHTREVLEFSIPLRDKQIADAVVLEGKRMADVARQFGLASDSYVSRCVRKHHPTYNARVAGQRYRREAHR